MKYCTHSTLRLENAATCSWVLSYEFSISSWSSEQCFPSAFSSKMLPPDGEMMVGHLSLVWEMLHVSLALQLPLCNPYLLQNVEVCCFVYQERTEYFLLNMQCLVCALSWCPENKSIHCVQQHEEVWGHYHPLHITKSTLLITATLWSFRKF